MDRGSGRYNRSRPSQQTPAQSAGYYEGKNYVHLHGKVHVNSSPISYSKRTSDCFPEVKTFASRDLLETNKIKQQQREQVRDKNKEEQPYIPVDKDTECPSCYPPVGDSTDVKINVTMGNKNSSAVCTCKLEEQRRCNGKPFGRGHNRKGKHLREGDQVTKLDSPTVDESLSEVLQNLQIHSGTVNGQIPGVPQHVLYYAWFFDNDISISLRAIAHSYLTECLLIVPFKRFIQSLLCSNDIQDPLQLYLKPGKRKPDEKLQYHVTAKFCDRKKYSPYQENVQPFIGKKFKLHIVGLFFTEKTFGFRIKLSSVQQALFDEKRNSTVPTKEDRTESQADTCNFNWEKVSENYEMEIAKDNQKTKDPKCKSDLHNSYPGIVLVRQKEDFHPTDSRAHITIGCTRFVKAVQTGEDLVDILNLETRPKVFHQDYQIHGATLRQFGRNPTAFVIYPNHEIITHAIFNVFI